jgi:hypothetical protein
MIIIDGNNDRESLYLSSINNINHSFDLSKVADGSN